MADINTKATPKPKAKAKLDAARLTRLADRIEVMKARRLTDLIHELETEEKAKIADKGPALGWAVSIAGIRATGTAGILNALTNWANAARRAVRSGEAV
jgi:hypothetical protein